MMALRSCLLVLLVWSASVTSLHAEVADLNVQNLFTNAVPLPEQAEEMLFVGPTASPTPSLGQRIARVELEAQSQDADSVDMAAEEADSIFDALLPPTAVNQTRDQSWAGKVLFNEVRHDSIGHSFFITAKHCETKH
jgi:hypothetical protein